MAAGRAPDRRRGPRPGRRPSAGPTWPSRSNGSRRGPIATRAASGCRRPAARPSRSRGSWSGRRGPAGSSRPPPPTARRRRGIEVESLLRRDEAPHRGLTYRRLLRRLGRDDRAGTGRRSSSPTPGRSPRRSPTTCAGRSTAGARGDRRAPLGARRDAPPRGRGGAEGGRRCGRSSPARAWSWASTSARPTSRSWSACPAASRAACSGSAGRGTGSGRRRAA